LNKLSTLFKRLLQTIDRGSLLLREMEIVVGASAQRVRTIPSRWCSSRGKRWMDIIFSSLMLLLLSPLLFLIALAIRISSGKPVIFRQRRSGRGGRQFQLLKFRTMTVENTEGPRLTRSGDSRVTPIGRWLRKSKLDELPQLMNVLRGDMSLVGPRPDLEEFWQRTTEPTRQALALLPGITGAACLVFRNEESLLAQIAPGQLFAFYVETLLPLKSQLDLDYAARATFFTDCGVLLRTITAAARTNSTTTHTASLFHEQLSRQ
jgi:lipopolysaccharide/colanic/teichoic acid biosynthesis glycosyltransferase